MGGVRGGSGSSASAALTDDDVDAIARSVPSVRWVAPHGDHAGAGDLGYPVRVKRGPRRIKAEHDDAVRVAELLHLPIREVARRAEEVAYRLFDGDAEGDGDGTRDGGDRGPAEPEGTAS